MQEVRDWARSLAAGGWNKYVRRAGVMLWDHWWDEQEDFEQEQHTLIADLGNNDDISVNAMVERLQNTGLNGETAIKHTPEQKPKVVFRLSPARNACWCEHRLAEFATAFEQNRMGKSLRGFDALLDVVCAICGNLRFLAGLLEESSFEACKSCWNSRNERARPRREVAFLV